MNSIGILFSPEPDQWGLRGDPYLWREMAVHFRDTPFPRSAPELTFMLEVAFFELTGHRVSGVQSIQIQRYAHGGMSSGCVATEFWQRRGIPLLVSRFMVTQEVRK